MYKNVDTEEAYIAANKYIKKSFSPFGAGVITSYDEDIEKTEAKKCSYLKGNLLWFKINIPAKEYLLDVEKPVSEQSDSILNGLFADDALQTLFTTEASEMYEKIKKYNEENKLEGDRALEFHLETMNQFYNEKKEMLLQLPDGISLVRFIQNQTVKNDIEIASSFLSHYGILGTSYKDSKGERVMIYDAQRDIQITNFAKK